MSSFLWEDALKEQLLLIGKSSPNGTGPKSDLIILIIYLFKVIINRVTKLLNYCPNQTTQLITGVCPLTGVYYNSGVAYVAAAGFLSRYLNGPLPYV